MAQYTNSVTLKGVVTTTTLDTTTDTQTITVTLPTGQVATATQPGTTEGMLSTTTDQLISQFNAQGVTTFDGPSVIRGVSRTATDVVNQSLVAQREARATNTSPPAEKQAIPVPTTSDAAVPQPKNETADTVPNTDTTTTPPPVSSDDPETAAVLAAQAEANAVVAEQNQAVDDADPFEAARLRAEQELANQEPAVYSPADLGVEELTPEQLAQQEEAQRLNREALSREDARDAAITAAFKEKAKQQATFQARYKQTANQDWRVRLSLSPNAQYLYNAGTPRGSGAGILAPLAATDGVIFPYTPSITTVYSANYEQYDLVHSNYRGVFYKNSRVGDINIRGTFTAQDTNEANYLLAVIHFFRSATKMFYGQDAERGTPPPVCLLNGLGTYQFSDHPVVISSFNYTTPNDVDYIRATNPNNFGSNLLNRRAAVASNPGGSSLAGLNRLLNAAQKGLSKGALPNEPAPGSVQQSVNNTAGATYVPTKMEIDITLIPVQTRSQVSKQFSLKGFANGDLLKGGFW